MTKEQKKEMYVFFKEIEDKMEAKKKKQRAISKEREDRRKKELITGY